MLRLERHPFGPRVYLLHRRIHEYHLGLAILVALAAGSFLDDVDLGLTTIVTAFYLYRRRRGALHVAVGLLLALGVLNLAKGLDFEEAVWSFAAAGLLWWGRAAFHVRHDPAGLRSAFYRVPAVVAATTILIVGSVWIAAPSGARAGAILRTAGDALLWQPGPIAFPDEMGRLPLAVGLLALAALLACA